MSTMMAYRYVPGTSTVVPQRVPIPEPKEGEVLLRVQAAGLCHSDLHVLHGVYRGTPMGDLSYTLGHEICGKAHSVHPSVHGVTLGSNYVAVGTNPCGTCPSCLAGRDNLCKGPKHSFGLGRDGGFAEFVTAPAENVVLVPEGVSPAQASACTDALLTPYHGIREIANVKSHENVVVIGLGGVGMNALKIAKLFGNEVFASDVKPEALQKALAAGASSALPTADLERLLTTASAPPIHVIVDCVGVQATFDFAQRIAAPGGRVLLLGLGAAKLEWNVAANLEREVALLMSFWGTKKALSEVLELVKEGKLKPEVEERKMSELPESVTAMDEGRVKGRLAFVP